ncbi:MAG: efflux RND transporter periplasmic adaptor subunit [Caulobacteraceae bacterium]
MLLVVAAAAALCACHKPPQETTRQQARAVTVAVVAPRLLAGGLVATGQLIPREDTAVFPELTGYRVTRVFVDEGAWVKGGQPLAQMDDVLLKDARDQQAALAAQQKVLADQAEAQAARVRGVQAEGLLSDEQIQARRFAARSARAQYNAQAALARDAANRVALTTIRAPYDGLVIERDVRPGDVSAPTNPWFRIAKAGQIELDADVSEGVLSKLRPGDKAKVTLADGDSALGVIRLVSPRIDTTTRLGKVRITLPVRPDIRAGGYARASFLTATRPALTVPDSAVRYDADGASVMAVGADDRLVRVAVTTGQRGGGFVELITGPPVGTRVVAKAGAMFTPGDYVRIAGAQTASAR